MTSSLRIIVSGLIAQYPFGGVAWDYLQYILGLRQLGHDVYYLEDTEQWPYHPIEDCLAREASFHIAYLSHVMSHFGLDDKWAYCFPHDRQWFGLPDSERTSVINSADLLINVSCALARPDSYRSVKRLVYVDTDPVFTQIKLVRGQKDFQGAVDAHDVLFSYGERLAESGPDTGHLWHPMRKPIVISEWRPNSPHRDVFTTVMNWTSYKDVHFQGQSYGQKDAEFMQFIDLPAQVAPTILEMAVGQGKTRRMPRELLTRKGWRLVDPLDVSGDFESYRRYIKSSKAEWTVAKNGYVVGQAGWFSGRSACYLAAGRPVVVQDTGFASVIPVGEGVLTFRSMNQAIAAIKKVEANYAQHAKAAHSIAEEYFDAKKVLSRLIEIAMN